MTSSTYSSFRPGSGSRTVNATGPPGAAATGPPGTSTCASATQYADAKKANAQKTSVSRFMLISRARTSISKSVRKERKGREARNQSIILLLFASLASFADELLSLPQQRASCRRHGSPLPPDPEEIQRHADEGDEDAGDGGPELCVQRVGDDHEGCQHEQCGNHRIAECAIAARKVGPRAAQDEQPDDAQREERPHAQHVTF